MNITILKFISTIRDSFVGSQQVFTEGSCWHFHLILKAVFGSAIPYDNMGHVISKIGEKFYDITGAVVPDLNSIVECDDTPTASLNKPFNIYKITFKI